MKIVQPYTHCCLLLDERTGFPRMTITAKAVLYHLLKEHGYGLDANKVPFYFKDMKGAKVSVYPDQPVMRSAPDHLTGEATLWVIPTVFIPTYRFWYGGHKKWSDKNLPSVRQVYDHYKGVCQRCLRKIPSIRESSRDHWVPRKVSRDHGHEPIHDIVNITLMCKQCNSDLGHSFPKYDIHGHEIRPRLKVSPSHWIPSPDQEVWPGWADHAPWIENYAELE